MWKLLGTHVRGTESSNINSNFKPQFLLHNDRLALCVDITDDGSKHDRTELKWSPDRDILSILTAQQGLLCCPCAVLPRDRSPITRNILYSELNAAVRWKTDSGIPHNALP